MDNEEPEKKKLKIGLIGIIIIAIIVLFVGLFFGMAIGTSVSGTTSDTNTTTSDNNISTANISDNTSTEASSENTSTTDTSNDASTTYTTPTTDTTNDTSAAYATDNTTNTYVTDNTSTPITLTSGNYTVGEDFPAGTYDIEAVSGSGNVMDNDSTSFLDEIMAPQADSSEGIISSYTNAIFSDGDVLTVNDVTIKLVPVN